MKVYGPKILVISFSERLKLSVQGLQILLHFHHPSKAKQFYSWLNTGDPMTSELSTICKETQLRYFKCITQNSSDISIHVHLPFALSRSKIMTTSHSGSTAGSTRMNHGKLQDSSIVVRIALQRQRSSLATNRSSTMPVSLSFSSLTKR